MNKLLFPIKARKLLLIGAFLISNPLWAGTFYKWIDDKGTLHFSDTIGKVPPKYRSQIKEYNVKGNNNISPKEEVKDKKVQSEKSTPKVNKKEKKLKEYIIPYESYEGDARRVIVKVKFNNSVTAPILLDTGSPETIISTTLAQKLKLFDEDENNLLVEVGGIGGSALAIRTIINSIQVGKAKAEFIPAHIVEPLSGAFEGLIGMDFMTNYTLTIDGIKQVIFLKENPASKKLPAGRSKKWWKSKFKEFNSYQEFWEQQKTYVKKRKSQSVMASSERKKLNRLQAIVDEQSEESRRLLNKLTRYASKHYVPMHWR